MASRSREPEKRPGFFRQTKALYTFTQSSYRWLPFLLVGVLLIGIGAGVVVGFLIPPVAVWSVILWGITGLMAGVLGALMIMTRLSTSAMYQKLDGMPGASGQVLSTMLGRRWQASAEPVAINPKTHDGVYRTIGRGGVVLVGEGARGRLTRLVNEERAKVTRVAQGVPVTVLYVGAGEDEVPISRLSKRIKSLPKALNRGTMAAVIKRVDSMSQSAASLPIPKGIDPMRVRAQRPR